MEAGPEETSAAEQLKQRKWIVGRMLITKGPFTSVATPPGMASPDGISAEDLKLLAALPHLENLQLTNVRLDESALAAIGKLGTLKVLGVSTAPGFQGSNFPADGATHLLGLPKLESLSFNGTPIADEVIETLATSTTIRRMHLADTAVTDAGLKAVAKMPQLEELQLPPHATDAGLQELVVAGGLKLLKLPSARPPGITDAGLAEFQKARPNCKVE